MYHFNPFTGDLDEVSDISSVNIIDDETPGGDMNGGNVTFTLTNIPVANTLKLYLNGQRLKDGGVDYTLTGSTITMVSAPYFGNILVADYRI